MDGKNGSREAGKKSDLTSWMKGEVKTAAPEIICQGDISW